MTAAGRLPEFQFSKGHGTGNDFVLIADPEGKQPLTADTVRLVADRRFGIGSDGVIRAVRAGWADDTTLSAAPSDTWAMDYWNADGSLSEMCGNGLRVFAAFLEAEGLIAIPDGEGIDVSTRAGLKRIERRGDSFAANLGAPTLGGDRLVSTVGLDVARPGLEVSIGNPHVVVALASTDELSGLELEAAPRLQPETSGGANVEFVVPGDISSNGGALTMRVHERGSGETLSCGTGAVAAAWALRHWAGGATDTWRVEVPGGTLHVDFDEVSEAWLSGPATIVARGTTARRAQGSLASGAATTSTR